MKSSELQQKLQNISQNFASVKLTKLTIIKEKKQAVFSLTTNKAFTEQEKITAEKICQSYTPPDYTANCEISKKVADSEIICEKVLNYIENNFFAAFSFLQKDDIKVEIENDDVLVLFYLIKDEKEHFESRNIPEHVCKFLQKEYCEKFTSKVILEEKERENIELETDSKTEYEVVIPARKFKVCNFQPLLSMTYVQEATYIADCNKEDKELNVCGKIRFFNEKVTSKGKPFFTFLLDDTTGNLRVAIFPKKTELESVRKLKEGDSVLCFGANEVYNGYLSFTAKIINYATLPENFEPEKRQSKPAPLEYKIIKPEIFTDYTQSTMFDLSVPQDLKNNAFVVFDLETTGLNNTPSVGRMDKITEIGAVKIINGKIEEKFTTLINPERKLSKEIVELTGITDDMLVNAPKIEEVVGDFFKFCEGCNLVGHNVPFDYKFIDYYSSQEGYLYSAKLYDTCLIAQEKLKGLSNYKLNTIADYYKIVFEHHRAFDDALTTAKIFINLVKEKKCLPND